MKPPPDIDALIQKVRGQKVILAADLAALYGLPTKRLNEQVKRNASRFPKDFMFQLSAKERDKVVANCDHLARLKFSKARPYAFTEHGAIMAATVLNSIQAVAMSLYVVRGFVKMREQITGGKDVLRRLAEMDKTLLEHDLTLQDVLEKLEPLLNPPEIPRRMIGFHP